ncbi:MAG: hypothetical protein ACE5JI_04840 [Acidobacteriota bacterium]
MSRSSPSWMFKGWRPPTGRYEMREGGRTHPPRLPIGSWFAICRSLVPHRNTTEIRSQAVDREVLGREGPIEVRLEQGRRDFLIAPGVAMQAR